MFPGQEQLIIDYYVKNQQALESLKGPILEGKAVQDILDNKISSKEKEYSISDLEKMLKEENDRELI
jgi:trigger factor